MIKEMYKGDNALAITKYKGRYESIFGTDAEDLKAEVDRMSKLFPNDFRVLFIYNNVNAKCVEPIERTIELLKRNKEVDLEKVLE